MQDLLASLRRRLEAYWTGGDVSAILADEALTEALALMQELEIEVRGGGPLPLPVVRVVALLYWSRSRELPSERGADTVEITEGLLTALGQAVGWPAVWADQAGWLLQRVERVDDLASLDEAVGLLSQATADKNAAGRYYGRWMSRLSILYEIRAERYDDVASTEKAVAAARAAVESVSAGHPERPEFLNALGGALSTRFQQSRDRYGIDGAVAAYREAVEATPAGHPYLSVFLTNYAEALRVRYENFNSLADLEDAVRALRQVIEILPDSVALSSLCRALRARSDRFGGNIMDINEAVTVGRQAVAETPDGAPGLGTTLYVLCVALIARFELTGNIADIDEAVDIGRQSVAAIADGRTERSRALSYLSGALLTRFTRIGNASDLDAAVTAAREAVAGAPRDATIQHNLSYALQTRFEQGGELADLNDAVAASRIAVAEATADIPERSVYLSSLGIALLARFDRANDPADLDTAIDACRESVESVPVEHLDRAACLSMYSIALRRRSGVDDLDAAVDAGRAAVDAVAPGHSSRATYLFNLGATLYTRFQVTKSPADINEAIERRREAVEATPADHPYRGRFQYGLGQVLCARFQAGGEASDASDALDLWQQAATISTAPTVVRVEAARAWGDLAAALSEWQSAADGFAEAVQLLPLLAWPGAGWRSRERLLAAQDGLATDAAACAIAAGLRERAVELLEQARGVLWSQMLETRTDLAALHEAYPELAARLDQVRAQLDSPAATAEPGTARNFGLNTPADIDARMSAAREWDALLSQVRELPGFRDFARPPAVAELLKAASGGTVVMINIGGWRCDALLVTVTGVEVKELPSLTRAATVEHVNTYLHALQAFQMADEREKETARKAMERVVTDTLEWLWKAIAEPVLEKLGHHSPPASGQQWPRIWWCPTGPLAFLPLHAAGRHCESGDLSVFDRAVSSYAPTIRALSAARARPQSNSPGRLLLIAQPHTPGQKPLPAVYAEKGILIKRFAGTDQLTVLESAEATHAAIIKGLPTHPWVHAACHGDQNLGDPASGGLLPYDWRSAGMVSLLDLAATQHGGEFAYLSACKSATGGVTNIDEAISLAAALHYVGWRHVIGTLWSVWDADAVRITDGVYQRLSSGVSQLAGAYLDLPNAAEALHHALREYRRQDNYASEPSRWAPFLHIGP